MQDLKPDGQSIVVECSDCSIPSSCHNHEPPRVWYSCVFVGIIAVLLLMVFMVLIMRSILWNWHIPQRKFLLWPSCRAPAWAIHREPITERKTFWICDPRIGVYTVPCLWAMLSTSSPWARRSCFHARPRYCNSCTFREEMLTGMHRFCVSWQWDAGTIIVPDINTRVLSNWDYMFPTWSKWTWHLASWLWKTCGNQ